MVLFTNNCRVALPKARSGLLRQAVTANPTVISEMGPLSVRVSGFPMPTALPAAEELHAKAPKAQIENTQTENLIEHVIPDKKKRVASALPTNESFCVNCFAPSRLSARSPWRLR